MIPKLNEAIIRKARKFLLVSEVKSKDSNFWEIWHVIFSDDICNSTSYQKRTLPNSMKAKLNDTRLN